MSKERVTTVRIPAFEYDLIMKLVKEGRYLNFSDFLRKAVKKLLESESEAS